MGSDDKSLGFSATTIEHIITNRPKIDFEKTSTNYYRSLLNVINPKYVSLKQKAFLENGIDFQAQPKKNRRIL